MAVNTLIICTPVMRTFPGQYTIYQRVPGLKPSPGEISWNCLQSISFAYVYLTITLLFKWQRNVWPIRNAGEPGTAFISARRNVCQLNFLHQSWLMGGDFPLVRGVCLHMQQSAITDEPSEIRGTSSL